MIWGSPEKRPHICIGIFPKLRLIIGQWLMGQCRINGSGCMFWYDQGTDVHWCPPVGWSFYFRSSWWWFHLWRRSMSINCRNDGGIDTFAGFLMGGLYWLVCSRDDCWRGSATITSRPLVVKSPNYPGLHLRQVWCDWAQRSFIANHYFRNILLTAKTFVIGHYKQITIAYHHEPWLTKSKHTSSKAIVHQRPSTGESIGHD